MSTADQNTLESLHKVLAASYATLMANPETCTPALLAAAARFLKDNNVVLIPESQSALEDVAKKYEKLSVLDDEDSRHIEFPKKQA